MEIERDEEYSIYSGFETDSNSQNFALEPNQTQKIQKNDFTTKINSSKIKLYQDQFISMFNKYNIDTNYIYNVITNYANNINNNDHTDIDIDIDSDYNNFIFYAEKLITKIYNIKYFFKENKINELIQEIKSINENILNNKKILFIIHREKLIYLIKNNCVNDSLIYTQRYMVPLTINNECLYKELGSVMSLLAYNNLNDFPDKELFNESNKNKNEDEILSYVLKFLVEMK